MISVDMIALPPLAYISYQYIKTGEIMFWITGAILVDPPSASLQIF